MTTRKPVVVSAPNGLPIVGTLELCPCRSRIAQFWRNTDGTLDFDYSGPSEMFYEEQRVVVRRNERVFLDEQGNEWRESELIVIEATGFATRNGGISSSPTGVFKTKGQESMALLHIEPAHPSV